ncbi:MAG: histidine phosphatase family protein [Phycisphaerales bacterium]|nr:histidine phosphatase family protein [Phycisphaerales bacterium]
MTEVDLPWVVLVRHGETEWSRLGRHTGRTDLPLTDQGRRRAIALSERLKPLAYQQVWVSPLQRAKTTCELAGFGQQAQAVSDLLEYDYGLYEGKTTTEICATRPGWRLFHDGCPQGESVADIAARADRLVSQLKAANGNILIFSSGHLLRMLAVRWLALPPAAAESLLLDTASVSILGYDRHRDVPAIKLWNVSDCSPLALGQVI